MPQQDPMASLGGLLQLIGGMNELGYREQDQQLKQQQFDQQGQQMQFEQGLAQRADTRAGSALTLQRMQFEEDRKRGQLGQQKALADMEYQKAATAQGNQQMAMTREQLDATIADRQQRGLFGLIELVGGSQAGVDNPQLITGLLQLAMQNAGIVLPETPNPQAAQIETLQRVTGSSNWSPSSLYNPTH